MKVGYEFVFQLGILYWGAVNQKNKKFISIRFPGKKANDIYHPRTDSIILLNTLAHFSP